MNEGIAESAESLIATHESLERYFHFVSLGRPPWNARTEIIETAASHLKVNIDRTTALRIALIGDGFPYYVHFLAEKLFWVIFESNRDDTATPEILESAMQEAASVMDMKLRMPYEKVMEKYNDSYSAILFAVADGYEFRKRSVDIFKVYQRILKGQNKCSDSAQHINTAINRLKSSACGSILIGSGAGWYEFSEKMIRGYVRLKAEQANVRLSPDHPEAATLLRYISEA